MPLSLPQASIGSSPLLLLPHQRPVPEHLSQHQPLRLPPVENRLDEVRRQACERQKPADVGDGDILVLGEIGDRLRLSSALSMSVATQSD